MDRQHSYSMGTGTWTGFLDEETGTKLEDSYKWTVIPLPASGDGETAVQVALSDMICMNNSIEDEETKEMAYKFAMFFAGDYMSEFSKLPISCRQQ